MEPVICCRPRLETPHGSDGVPTCWTILGQKRIAPWTFAFSSVRDKFGFDVDEGTHLFTNAFDTGAVDPAVVDYSHGEFQGHDSRVQVVLYVIDSEQTYFLEKVCSFRAVMHFVSRWRGFVRRRWQQRATVHILEGLLGHELAVVVGHFACDRFRAPWRTRQLVAQAVADLRSPYI